MDGLRRTLAGDVGFEWTSDSIGREEFPGVSGYPDDWLDFLLYFINMNSGHIKMRIECSRFQARVCLATWRLPRRTLQPRVRLVRQGIARQGPPCASIDRA
jgi:hypothetical protein